MDERADALYELPAGEFVAARDRLAKELKAEGAVKAAQEVKALKKPTVVAAALNRIARDHPDEIQSLLDAGTALESASGAALRAAGRARRDAVQAVVRLAPAAHRDGVSGTLEAALVDPDLATALVAGRLTKEAEAPAVFGFGALPEPADDAPADEPEPAVDVEALQREADEAQEALAAARADVDDARRAFEEAEAALVDATERAESAAAALGTVRSH